MHKCRTVYYVIECIFYGKALSEEEAMNEMRRCSGIQFDPTIARVFIEKVLGKEWE
jgi:HD-GYP domain-containing protein (c-di-GMP phosphodiesterase class II)